MVPVSGKRARSIKIERSVILDVPPARKNPRYQALEATSSVHQSNSCRTVASAETAPSSHARSRSVRTRELERRTSSLPEPPVVITTDLPQGMGACAGGSEKGYRVFAGFESQRSSARLGLEQGSSGGCTCDTVHRFGAQQCIAALLSLGGIVRRTCTLYRRTYSSTIMERCRAIQVVPPIYLQRFLLRPSRNLFGRSCAQVPTHPPRPRFSTNRHLTSCQALEVHRQAD